ncbi:MAG: type II toxin-antitoxin system VapC family toxin [Acidobacteriota bacterium]
MKYLLDTHAWIWWNMHPQKLSRKARSLISSPSRYEELLLSAISVWELAKLIEKRRLAISCDPEEWIEQALEMPKLRLVPLSPAIAYRSTVLPEAFHDDPADQIIVATARDENATIVTSDERIRAYPHCRSFW